MQSPAPFLRIGTRGSPLALVQAHLVQSLLAKAHEVAPERIEIIVISTSGDRIQDRPLSEVGGKGLFTKEIEQALLDGAVDLGVHSSKDVATTLPNGLELPVFLEREDIRDAFVSLTARSVDELPNGSRFGTSSLRRAAQMLRYRPDFSIVPFRGNVDTRLKKLADGVADATLLASAGLNRLGKADRATSYLDPRLFPPAPAQGAIGIEIRQADERTRALVKVLNHAATHIAVTAERAFLRRLDGSCRTPIAAYSVLEGTTLTMTGQILSLDGRQCFELTHSGPQADADALGWALGEALVAKAGPAFVGLFS